MKIAIVGKGGSGKTTTAAVLSHRLAQQGMEVVALDCDTNPNLGISLGVGEDETERLVAMRQALDAADEDGHAQDWDTLLDRFGTEGPEGLKLAVVCRIDNPDPGCPCCGLSPEQLLGSVDPGASVIVADFEAGLGTLTRLGEVRVDTVVVVVEAMAKSIEVGTRAARHATQHSTDRVVVVANRIRGEEDLVAVHRAFPDAEILVVPEDPAIGEADRNGVAAFAASPGSPAVRALAGLADLVGC